MLDFGTTASQNYAITFADRAILDAMTKYTICFTVRPRVTGWTANRGILTKWTALTGWTLRTDLNAGNNVLRMIHGTGAATAGVSSTSTLAINTTYRIICAWDGTNLNFYINNGSAEGGAFSTVIAANANKLNLGNEDGATVSPQAAIGQIFIYPNYAFSASERSQWDAGQTVPAAGQLEFWHKGLEIPGSDRVRAEMGVQVGTSIVALSDPTDAYFPDFRANPQWRRLATHRLMRRRTQEPIFRLTVPDHYLSIPLSELFQLSHDSMFLSASRLAGTPLGELLASQPWRRSSVRLVGVTDHPLERTVELRFKDHEAFGSSYWSTDRLPEGTNEGLSGLGRLDVGGIHTVTRSSKAYLETGKDALDLPGTGVEGQFVRPVGAFAEKMNHVGFLAEDATDNPILNSHVTSGETSWTGFGNGGFLTLETYRAYPDVLQTVDWSFKRNDNTNNTYREQLFAVLSADGFRRIYLVKTERSAAAIVSWQLQRSTDSWYWNDSSGAWQSAAVWNRLTNTYDAALGRGRIARNISKPVSIGANENWTLRMGIEGAANPNTTVQVDIYSAQALKGKLRFSDVPTVAAAVTTDADVVNVERTSLPQIVSATRYTATCRMVAIQDSGDLVDGDKLCLWYLQYSNTDADDYDVLIYEKPAGASARFSFERYINGSLSGTRATYTGALVPGTEYKIAAIATAASGNDLGLANSTLRLVVNGVQGVDGIAAANQSASEAHTELWKGCAPSAASLKRSMNYLWNLRFWTRCLTNEEAQAA